MMSGSQCCVLAHDQVLGTIFIPKVVSVYDYPEVNCFQIHTHTRKYILEVLILRNACHIHDQAQSNKEKDQWMAEISKCSTEIARDEMYD